MNLARYLILAVMLGTLATFAVRFPDAPLGACPSGYCGKQGQPHSEADFHLFTTFETALFVIWPVGMLGLSILPRTDKTRPKNSKAKRHPRFGGR